MENRPDNNTDPFVADSYEEINGKRDWLYEKIKELQKEDMANNFNSRAVLDSAMNASQNSLSRQTPQSPHLPEIPLSICTIYNAADRDLHIEKYYARLPKGSEVCLMETVPTIDNDFSLKLISEQTDNNNIHIRHAQWFYPAALFSFAAARNACKSFATREWIINIDMDERLNWNIDDFSPFFNLKNQSVGAAGVYVFDIAITESNPHGVLFGNCQYRMFRNMPDIKYSGAVHENVNDSLIALNLKPALSNITIRHDGYNVSDEVNIKKAWRNTALGVRDLIESGFDKYRLSKLYDSLHFLDLHNQLPHDETNNLFVKHIMKG